MSKGTDSSEGVVSKRPPRSSRGRRVEGPVGAGVMPFFRAYGSTEFTTTTAGIRDRANAQMGAETDGDLTAATLPILPQEIKNHESQGFSQDRCRRNDGRRQ